MKVDHESSTREKYFSTLIDQIHSSSMYLIKIPYVHHNSSSNAGIESRIIHKI